MLVGIVIASDMPRARRRPATSGPATGAFGVARSRDEPAAAHHERAYRRDIGSRLIAGDFTRLEKLGVLDSEPL
jgi:hypothetical protein